MIENSNRISVRYASFQVGIHLLGVIGLVYFCFHFSWSMLLAAVGYFFILHLSTTVGAHRYFTHESFLAQRWFARVLAALHAGTLQGPLLWWCGRHLQHHAYEDKPGLDPHTPNDGFWHSHILWTLKPAAYLIPPRQFLAGFGARSTRNDAIRWQSKRYVVLALMWTLIVPAILGLLLGNIVTGMLFIGFTRLIFQYHATWVVNSVGHKWGDRLSGRTSARNVGWKVLASLSGIITVGEAHHANHHAKPQHWRLGWKWWQFDPGTTMIRIAHRFGWITELKH